MKVKKALTTGIAAVALAAPAAAATAKLTAAAAQADCSTFGYSGTPFATSGVWQRGVIPMLGAELPPDSLSLNPWIGW